MLEKSTHNPQKSQLETTAAKLSRQAVDCMPWQYHCSEILQRCLDEVCCWRYSLNVGDLRWAERSVKKRLITLSFKEVVKAVSNAQTKLRNIDACKVMTHAGKFLAIEKLDHRTRKHSSKYILSSYWFSRDSLCPARSLVDGEVHREGEAWRELEAIERPRECCRLVKAFSSISSVHCNSVFS